MTRDDLSPRFSDGCSRRRLRGFIGLYVRQCDGFTPNKGEVQVINENRAWAPIASSVQV